MSILTLILPRPSVDGDAFHDAMAHLASGVAVVACWDGAEPRGLLVSALTALSTQPPRVLFCVAKTASAHDALLRAEECSLNLLSEGDQEEAERFSRRDRAGHRFDPRSWRLEPGAPPARRDALMEIVGFVDQKIDAGSHSMFIVRVNSAETRDHAPLIQFGRGFHRLAAAN
jgi:flavin reductase